MTLKNYRSTAAIVFGSLLMTMSCNENSNLTKPVNSSSTLQTNSNNSSARLSNYTFDGTEGDPIPLDVADRWISNYTNQNLGKLSAHYFGGKALKKMLNSGSMGIRFYYSVDDAGNPILFATPADNKGQDFSSNYKSRARNSSVALKTLALSANSFNDSEADSIATTLSKHWKDNYYTANPSGIIAHFFGFEIIQQILAEGGCVGIRCYYALNDIGVQQLLLVGVTSSGQNILPSSSARLEDGDATVADMSYPCPSACGSGS